MSSRKFLISSSDAPRRIALSSGATVRSSQSRSAARSFSSSSRSHWRSSICRFTSPAVGCRRPSSDLSRTHSVPRFRHLSQGTFPLHCICIPWNGTQCDVLYITSCHVVCHAADSGPLIGPSREEKEKREKSPLSCATGMPYRLP